ncbi:MAG: glycosyltransferase family 39 protein [Nitrospirae bacterium]|nr:glycosyltransferase family 39 protein [Nitrospirota bacterium]
MTGLRTQRLQLLLLFFMVLAGLSVLPGLASYDFRGEEARRFLVAYEMFKTGVYLQPTLFGEPYFNKPPLFNWIVLGFAQVAGWNVLAVRLPSLLAALLTSVIVCRLSRVLYRDRTRALLSGLIFLTSLDVLYWYGWLGEIDATLTLFVSLVIFFQFLYFERRRGAYLLAAGLLAGIIFLLKGFVALVFFGIPLFTMALGKKQFRKLFGLPALLSYGCAAAIPLLWVLQIPFPEQYIATLMEESANRVDISGQIVSFLKHFITYPFLNVKQTLPASVFVLYAVCIGRARLRGDSRTLGLVCLFCYLPFLFAAGSAGRYILPLFPLAAVLAAPLILDVSATRRRLLNAFLCVTALLIIGRFLFGAFWLPYDQRRRGFPKATGREIMEVIDPSRPVSCDCSEQWTVCLYLDLSSGRVLKAPSVTRDWEYLVTCGRTAEGELLKTFEMHKAVVSVRKRH